MTVNSAGETVVEVRGLITRFGDRQVHGGISLEVFRGEVLAVVGESGSGKSVLLRHMLLLSQPAEGHVQVLGHGVTVRGAEARRLRRRIGVLFQAGALFSDLTVLENVMTPLREHTGLSVGLVNELSGAKLRMVGLSSRDATLYPAQLSGGMRKRAALARAIALDPELLFLDEPGSGLDPLGADAIDRLVLELKQSLGLTVIMVTHDMESLWRVADRVILLGGGKIIGEGSMEALYTSDDPAIRRFFRGSRRSVREGARV